MKLSDLDPKDVTLVKKAGGLKLSDIHPDDVTSVSKASDSSNLKDLGIGLGQGATLGFGDELLGGAQTAGDVLQGDISPTDLQSLYKSYREHQKDNEAGIDAAKARSPYLTTGGEIAGGILPALLSGGSSEAISGPMAAKTLGKLALEQAGKGAVFGGIAGAGGSHGTVEDLGQMAKDSAFGAGGGAALGAIMPIATDALAPAGRAMGNVVSELGSLAKKPLNALAQMIEDSPNLKNFNDARAFKRINNESFTSNADRQRILTERNSLIDNLTDQAYNGVKKSANEEYAEGLAGSDLVPTDKNEKLKAFNDMVNGKENGISDDEYNQFLTLGATPDQLAKEFTKSVGRGGMTVEGRALLQKAATKGLNNAQEAKTLQNLINDAKSKPGYADTNVPYDAHASLNEDISNSLPENDLASINDQYTSKLATAEPLMNAGEVNPALQKNKFNDTDPTQGRNLIADYLNTVIKKVRDPNTSGSEAKNTFNRYIENTKQLNEGLNSPELNPDAMAKSIDTAALKAHIDKSIYGERAVGQTVGIPSSLVQGVTGAPMRAALGIGAIQKGADKLGNSIASTSRSVFNSSNENLSRLAQQLTGAGHIDIANSLNKALTSSDVGAKNAALFTIMQNPAYRQATQKFIDDHTKSDDSEGTN